MEDRLTTYYMRHSNKEFLENEEVRRGLELFEKNIGKINFFNLPQPAKPVIEHKKGIEYVVVKDGKEVYRTTRQKDAAKYLGVATPTLVSAIAGMKIIKDCMVYKERQNDKDQ